MISLYSREARSVSEGRSGERERERKEGEQGVGQHFVLAAFFRQVMS